MSTYIQPRITEEFQNFKPSNPKAAELGVQKAGNRWFFPDSDRAGTFIEIFANDKFARRGKVLPDETFEPLSEEEGGGWRLYGRRGEIDDTHHARFRPVAAHVSPPGGPMKDPWGERLYSDDGPGLDRPLSGEQDLHPWTGQLLFDENGDPVLVP